MCQGRPRLHPSRACDSRGIGAPQKRRAYGGLRAPQRAGFELPVRNLSKSFLDVLPIQPDRCRDGYSVTTSLLATARQQVTLGAASPPTDRKVFPLYLCFALLPENWAPDWFVSRCLVGVGVGLADVQTLPKIAGESQRGSRPTGVKRACCRN